MQVRVTPNAKHHDYYGLKLLFSLILMILFLTYTSFYLMQNYYSQAFLEYGVKGKKIYFLQSDTLKSMYKKSKMDYKAYQTHVEYFKQLSLKNGYQAVDIYSDKLQEIGKNELLIGLDMMALSSDEMQDIETFVSQGGKLFFNFTSGFIDASLEKQDENLVSKITGLQLDKNINTLKQNSKEAGVLSTKLLSPLAKYLQEGKGIGLTVYDALPIFHTKDMQSIDTYLTTWTQTDLIKVDEQHRLQASQSGLIWHGYKDAGKWVYFNFPGYVFMDVNQDIYAKLFQGMLEYLEDDISVMPYPYIDAKNIVFVSEDTEYKFENLERFYDISLQNKFPVTAFCVAQLAEKHKDLMTKVSKGDYFEVGSHSYSHQKIVGESEEVYKKEIIGSYDLLKKLTKQDIFGFRPPREEIDADMAELLEEGGYKYVLGTNEGKLSPYMKDDILMIPRKGTDDYSYLINLDWNSTQILQQMKKEVNLLVNLDAIYSMSTHTHLMSFASNINITDDFFKYVHSQKDMKPMNGKMIYERVSQRLKVSITTKQTVKKLILTINNSNNIEVKNMHFELYVDSDIVLKNIESEIIGTKTKLIKVSKNQYTLIVDSLKPRSQMLFFINYDKTI